MLSRITSRFKFNAVNTVTKSLIGAMVCCTALHTQAAAEVGADLIVLGSHGRTGIVRLMLGSVATKVVAESPVPVLVTR